MAKIVLTLQLQQDNGTPVMTGTQTKNSFTQDDYDLVRSFLVGAPLSNLVRIMGWVASGQVSVSGTPTLTISNLGN